MPTPKTGESKKEYITRCIPYVINEGTAKDSSQAAAICHSLWEKHTKANKADQWVTVEQMRELCPSCADKMVAKGLTRVNLAQLRDAVKAKAMEDLCSRKDFGFDEPGFFTRCREIVEDYSWVTDADGFCAELHYACVGKYPGEKAEEKAAKGGAGSGNFGHAGRPGEVGGSAPGGGGGAGGFVSEPGANSLSRKNDNTLSGSAVINKPLGKAEAQKYIEGHIDNFLETADGPNAVYAAGNVAGIKVTNISGGAETTSVDFEIDLQESISVINEESIPQEGEGTYTFSNLGVRAKSKTKAGAHTDLVFTAVKALDDWTLEVLGVPFGGPYEGKDADKQYFSARTKTYTDQLPTPLVVYYHGLQPNGMPQGDPELIGKGQYERTDAKGHWYKVVLDKTKAIARRIWEAAKKGLARASSGSLAHLVRIARDGEILNWPVAELALLDEQVRPINPYAVAMPAAKALYEKSGVPFPNFTEDSTDVQSARQGGTQTIPATKSTSQKKGIKDMEEKEVKDLVASAVTEALERAKTAQKAEEEAQKARKAEIDAAVKAEREKVEGEFAAKFRLPTANVAQFGDTWKYDNVSDAGLGLMIDILRSQNKPVNPSAVKALALRVAAAKDEPGEVLGINYVKAAMKACGLEPTEAAIKAATDPMYSTLSSGGSDWVGTAYSRDIWAAIRVGTQVVAKIPSEVIPDGYSSQYWPLESTDPTWYKVAEATAADSTMKFPAATVTASQLVTANKNIAVVKTGARVMYTGELAEDSLVRFADQLKAQLTVSGQEHLEHLVIDGDTATAATTNINDIGDASTQGGTEGYLVIDGFRKLALVTSTAQSRSGGVLGVDDYLETIKLMGTDGSYGWDVTKTGFIVPLNTYWKTMGLSEVQTRDVFSAPTLEGGRLKQLWGYDIIPSGQMHKMSAKRMANSSGKVHATDTNNLYGAILAVRWDAWKLAWKRRMTLETTRYANADTYEIVCLARLGMGYRDTEASAITYNLTV